ncbi:hypothetical protein [Haliangium ochraceum]|uniref:Uncharacterized protein n=1 Tax=Haliangium ochraceum (strain DSM 14365 / JCM 11303 / SMP-2) TaxID=502025 RepID=D0LI20_HALO1|nr:hypothetical protein [Haliangium ochraceum]ACY14849.1 hypothetical protein Hoch_2306 [Haliangium ochraceum DSM 14365]
MSLRYLPPLLEELDQVAEPSEELVRIRVAARRLLVRRSLNAHDAMVLLEHTEPAQLRASLRDMLERDALRLFPELAERTQRYLDAMESLRAHFDDDPEASRIIERAASRGWWPPLDLLDDAEAQFRAAAAFVAEPIP